MRDRAGFVRKGIRKAGLAQRSQRPQRGKGPEQDSVKYILSAFSALSARGVFSQRTKPNG